MKTTIDAAGRVVIPKKLRDEAGLAPGMELDVRCRDGRIEFEPAQGSFHLEERDGFLVIVPDGPMPTLTNEDVQRVIDQIRNERGRIDPEGELA